MPIRNCLASCAPFYLRLQCISVSSVCPMSLRCAEQIVLVVHPSHLSTMQHHSCVVGSSSKSFPHSYSLPSTDDWSLDVVLNKSVIIIIQKKYYYYYNNNNTKLMASSIVNRADWVNFYLSTESSTLIILG